MYIIDLASSLLTVLLCAMRTVRHTYMYKSFYTHIRVEENHITLILVNNTMRAINLGPLICLQDLLLTLPDEWHSSAMVDHCKTFSMRLLATFFSFTSVKTPCIQYQKTMSDNSVNLPKKLLLACQHCSTISLPTQTLVCYHGMCTHTNMHTS